MKRISIIFEKAIFSLGLSTKEDSAASLAFLFAFFPNILGTFSWANSSVSFAVTPSLKYPCSFDLLLFLDVFIS